MSNSNTLFKDFINEENILYEDNYFYIVDDGFPVSENHLLIISVRENAIDFFDLNLFEQRRLPKVINIAKSIIDKRRVPDGYNIGMNCGFASGQSVFQFHCHIIPRYFGDVENPRGGVRFVIPEKANY